MSEKPPFDPSAPFQEMTEDKPVFDSSQPYQFAGQPKDDRFNFEAKKVRDLPGSLMKALAVVPNVLKSGADAAFSSNQKDTLSNNLDRYFKSDPTYFPGDATAERAFDSPVGQMAAKTALDIGLDPTTWAGALTKGAAAAKGIAPIIESSPGTISTGLKTMGKLGEFFTGGRMSPKWAGSAAKFTPMEQIQAGKTLKAASSEYAPLKSAAEKIMSGRATPEQSALFSKVERFPDALSPATDEAITGLTNPAFNKFDSAVQTLEDVVNKVERTEGVIPAKLQVLLDRAKSIKLKGSTSGPESAELMDAINNLEYTGFGNPRAVRGMMKGAQAEMRGGLSDITSASSPEYSLARQRISDALNMTAPPTGGKMSKYVLQNLPTVAGGARAVQQAASGDIKGAGETAIATLLLRNPAAWNAVAGGSRLAPNLMSQGVKGVASFLAQNPEILQAAKVALVQLPKTDFGKTMDFFEPPNISKSLDENPQAFGKFSAVLQEAKQRGPKALGATDHILQQTKPEYREIKRQINGQEQPNE